ncbi:hypothetical protein RN001_012837 [Aquatica leii]|uniref:Magnesium transporter NIPA2 n=1 Tax=Aquatica leii TaxID=1421715 RepID=A0AAN7NYY1_9COLE|nr:hypothetical protein RN001_012837 [Aquatica leii]
MSLKESLTVTQSQIINIYDESEFKIGLLLAISSSIFIGSSFIIKKRALIRINRAGSVRAGVGGFGYLKEWIWWIGFLLMGLGEVANFTAYAFAPASLVTPLGALSVLVTAVLASKCLNEKLNIIGKLGCVLCLLGSTIIVIHSPKTEEVESLDTLMEKLYDSLFILYVIFVLVVSFLIVTYYGPKYGSQNILVYIVLCSAVGSLSVMACKGLGLALKGVVMGAIDLGNQLIYVFLSIVIICICIQINYLNKALDLFNISLVTPIYYVFFTTLVIVASTILFREWQHLMIVDIIGNISGFIIIVIAIILLQCFKDFNITYNDMQNILKPKQEYLIKNIKTDERSHYFLGSV